MQLPKSSDQDSLSAKLYRLFDWAERELFVTAAVKANVKREKDGVAYRYGKDEATCGKTSTYACELKLPLESWVGEDTVQQLLFLTLSRAFEKGGAVRSLVSEPDAKEYPGSRQLMPVYRVSAADGDLTCMARVNKGEYWCKVTLKGK